MQTGYTQHISFTIGEQVRMVSRTVRLLIERFPALGPQGLLDTLRTNDGVLATAEQSQHHGGGINRERRQVHEFLRRSYRLYSLGRVRRS